MKQRNIEARSGNHCCSGKEMSITQPYCVCVCSLRYPTCNAYAPNCHLACPALQNFSSLSQSHDFRVGEV